jgi:hypothetical protein
VHDRPMTNALDVLVIGDRSSAAAEQALHARGHRTHRCHAVDGEPVPCAGLRDPSACPLEGTIDVALLVRRGVQPQPLPHEDGVRCALRAGVPVLEDGPDLLDPYASWITARVGPSGDVASACTTTADRGHDHLRSLIADRIGRLTATIGVEGADVACSIALAAGGLRVDLTLPASIDPRLQHAIAVRALDAVRSSGPRYGHVAIDVRGSTV